MIKASIIIPCYEVSPLLRATMKSIEETADLPYQLIIVVKPQCVAKNRNEGLDRARHDLVFFTDDDVIFPEGWMRKLLWVLDAHPNVGVVGPNRVGLDGRPQRGYAGAPPGEILDFLIPGTVFAYFRSRCRDARFNEKYRGSGGEDTDWMQQVKHLGRRVVVYGGVTITHHGVGRNMAQENRALYQRKWG